MRTWSKSQWRWRSYKWTTRKCWAPLSQLTWWCYVKNCWRHHFLRTSTFYQRQYITFTTKVTTMRGSLEHSFFSQYSSETPNGSDLTTTVTLTIAANTTGSLTTDEFVDLHVVDAFSPHFDTVTRTIDSIVLGSIDNYICWNIKNNVNDVIRSCFDCVLDCQNFGTPTNTGTCVCTPDFTGIVCETEILSRSFCKKHTLNCFWKWHKR